MTLRTGICSRTALSFSFILFAAGLELSCPRIAHADFPSELAASEVDAAVRQYNCEKITIDVPAASFLLVPRASHDTDGKYHQPYHAACHVYVQDPDAHVNATAGYSQRFVVYGANQDAK